MLIGYKFKRVQLHRVLVGVEPHVVGHFTFIAKLYVARRDDSDAVVETGSN